MKNAFNSSAMVLISFSVSFTASSPKGPTDSQESLWLLKALKDVFIVTFYVSSKLLLKFLFTLSYFGFTFYLPERGIFLVIIIIIFFIRICLPPFEINLFVC